MKAATGELNLTLITVLALGAILAFFWAMWNGVIKDRLISEWDNSTSGNPQAYVEIVETNLI